MTHSVSPENPVVAIVMGSNSDYEVMKESDRVAADDAEIRQAGLQEK